MLKTNPLIFIGIILFAGLVSIVLIERSEEAARRTIAARAKIILLSPVLGQPLSSPLLIQGRILTPDNTAILRISDNAGSALSETPVRVFPPEQGRFGEFSKEVFLLFPATARDLVVEAFWRSPRNEELYKVVVPFTITGETARIRLYTANAQHHNNASCRYVTPMEREIVATDRLPEGAITALLQPLAETQLQQGFVSYIPKNSELQSLEIQNGVARVTFNAWFDRGVRG